MKKAEVVEFGEKLEISEAELPECPPDGAIIKVSYCGICHTDVSLWNPPDFFRKILKLPLVLGHEIAGFVHQLGPKNEDSSDLEVGDRVGMYTLAPCGVCDLCKAAEEPLCKERFRAVGIHLDGGYATYVSVLKEKYLVKLPDNIPTQVGAILGCAGITSYSAICAVKENASRMTTIKGKSSLLVIGCGGLGQLAIVEAKVALPGVKIVVADVNEQKLVLGKDLGADETVFWRRDMDEEVLLESTRSKGIENGFDCVIDFVANDVTMARSMKLMNKGGVLVLIGVSDSNIKIDYPVNAFVNQGYTMKGRLYGSLQEYKELIHLLGRTKPKFPDLTLFELENAFEALTSLKSGEIPCRAVLKICE